ncbi:MAG: RNA polymerase sigma factor [[Eubacterium] siraeum]|nr:RNA polymerase sigma factor [[Eubacterium] siraeum]
MEDTEIIGLFWQRKQSAISAASEKYGGLCNNVAYNILKNKEDSQECVNDTFLRAWNTIPPQKPKALAAYLAKITRNLALDKYRFEHRKKRGILTNIEEEAQEIFISEDTAQNEAERKELVETINGFLKGLPSKKRMIFMKRYWLLDSIKDIAAAFGMEENSVSVSLMRTRRELKAYLEKRGFDVDDK